MAPRERETAEKARFDELAALPYVSFSANPSAPGESGVLELDVDRSASGFNLYANTDFCEAKLIDAAGRVIRAWRGRGCARWVNCWLLPDGDLLVIGWDSVTDDGPANDRARHLLRLGRDDEAVLKVQMPAHHDLDLLPDGSALVLTARMRRAPEVDPQVDIRDSTLTRVSRDGALLEERSLYDALAGSPELHVMAVPKAHEGYVDLLHANTVDWFEGGPLAERSSFYDSGNVLVTVRHQNLVALIRWETGRALWTWGPGIVEGPHGAQLLASGALLLFDNGLVRGWSRILELDPSSGSIRWQLDRGPRGHFYSAERGAVQRLPNGNTLVTVSAEGEAFEVTPAGETVWHFVNPATNEKGQRATFFQVRRYTPEYVRRALGTPDPD